MTARQRRVRRRSRKKSGSILLGFGIVAAIGAIAALSFGVWVLSVAGQAPSLSELEPIDKGENSVVYAADGTRLGMISSDVIRKEIPLERIPEVVQHATLAIEDSNFYSHNGIDLGAIVRAAVRDLEAGEVVEGGSTITQQLVKNLYTGQLDDRDLEAKIQEAKLAQDVERAHDKRWILEQYLNTSSYGTNNGRTAIGIEAAARTYFSKPARRLRLREAALLAGLPQAPSLHNPLQNAEAAKRRRNQVLTAMADEGYISQADAARARAAGLGLNPTSRYDRISERFFFDYVTDQLISEYGAATVRQGGLEVHTTIDLSLQQAALDAIAAHPVSGAASALVAIDAETAEIKAMASSAQYDEDQFNLAAQGQRQPGSAFKIFALAAAVAQGADPDRVAYPAPSSITLNIGDGSPPWSVRGGGRGAASLRQATVSSINTVYAQLGLDVGPGNVAEMARDMGIESELQGFPAETIGGTSTCCTPLEMANAFGTLANGGVRNEPVAVHEVRFPDGRVEQPRQRRSKRVMPDGAAYKIAEVMKGVLTSGTAAGRGIGCPAAGKTGTTDAQADAWFVGFTPHLSTAVWVGNPNERVPLPGYGGGLAAPIWQRFMQIAAAEPCDDFPTPNDPFVAGDFDGSRSTSASSETDTTTTTTTDEADETDYDVEYGDDFPPANGPPEDVPPGLDEEFYEDF